MLLIKPVMSVINTGGKYKWVKRFAKPLGLLCHKNKSYSSKFLGVIIYMAMWHIVLPFIDQVWRKNKGILLC